MTVSKEVLLLLAYLLCKAYGKSINMESDNELGVWTPWTNCSRTCGTGISTRIWNCLTESCPSGRHLEYKSCCEQDCQSVSANKDFKEAQCRSALNDHWTLSNSSDANSDCTLDCVNVPLEVVAKLTLVADGTPCITRGTGQRGVCLGRLCTVIGCDGGLGSNKVEDKCLRCLSPEDSPPVSACTAVQSTASVTLNGTALLLDLPVGATTIKISRPLSPKNGILALSVGGQEPQMFLGTSQHIAGQLFTYSIDQQLELITARGPLTQSVSVQLVGANGLSTEVQYKFHRLTSSLEPTASSSHMEHNSVQHNSTTEYTWDYESFGECSVTCGSGIQVANTVCKDKNYPERVIDNAVCVERGVPRPAPRIMKCAIERCPARWAAGEWSGCPNMCDGGREYRTVVCHSPHNEVDPLVPDKRCSHLTQPNISRLCPVQCEEVEWTVGPWSNCTGRCDESQTRAVYCSEVTNGVIVGNQHCSIDSKPVQTRACECKIECAWIPAPEWKKCNNSCGLGEQTREVRCRNITTSHNMPRVNESCCAGQAKPPTIQQCFGHRAKRCLPHWQTGTPGPCEGPCCGSQYQTIPITCVGGRKRSRVQFPDSVCEGPKPADRRECRRQDCPEWKLSPFGSCSATCAPSFRSRTKECLLNGIKIANEFCIDCHGDRSTKQICSYHEPCPTSEPEPTPLPPTCADTNPNVCKDVPIPCEDLHRKLCCATCSNVP